MRVALVHDHYDADHLDDVKAQMMTLGTPTIKAVWMECYGHWAALEGCHRLRAAAELGLVPEIDAVEYTDDPSPVDNYTIAQLCDDSYAATIIEFEE